MFHSSLFVLYTRQLHNLRLVIEFVSIVNIAHLLTIFITVKHDCSYAGIFESLYSFQTTTHTCAQF